MSFLNWFKKKKNDNLNIDNSSDINDNLNNSANINDNPSDSANINDNPSDSANINDNPSDSSNINDNPSDSANINNNPSDSSNINDNESDSANINDNESDYANINDNPSDSANINDNESDYASINDNASDSANINDNPSDSSNINDNESDSSSINDNLNKKLSFFAKIKQSLTKTRNNIINNIEQVILSFSKIDEELFEELEEVLIMSDIGVETSLKIISEVKNIVKTEKIKDVKQIKNVIVDVITNILEKDFTPLKLKTPTVLLIIGVNGVGKTTSIGKLTNNFKTNGKKVILAAADTFRAAAIEQLEVWAKRNDVDLIKHQENSDPAAVVFDAIKAAKARKADILICDTAGRLHNKKNLMEELKKIARIIKRDFEDAQLETLLVLDATTGQNALQQAKLFSEVTEITGLILTKLDGTAKGGIVISIKNELNIPVRFIGIGEGIEDLKEFNANDFSRALFEE